MGFSWVIFWMRCLFEMRGKQGRQQRGSQISVIRVEFVGPGRRLRMRGLKAAKPTLADPADGGHRTLRLRRGDEQEDGVERGAGLDQLGKPAAMSG
jgi:hypothetical protein